MSSEGMTSVWENRRQRWIWNEWFSHWKSNSCLIPTATLQQYHKGIRRNKYAISTSWFKALTSCQNWCVFTKWHQLTNVPSERTGSIGLEWNTVFLLHSEEKRLYFHHFYKTAMIHHHHLCSWKLLHVSAVVRLQSLFDHLTYNPNHP